MKYLTAAFCVIAVSACASAPQTNEDQAWAKCNSIADRAVRANCITLALADAKADERAAKQAEQEDFDAAEKAIEDKAAIERAHGVPDDKTGTSIVREPFE